MVSMKNTLETKRLAIEILKAVWHTPMTVNELPGRHMEKPAALHALRNLGALKCVGSKNGFALYSVPSVVRSTTTIKEHDMALNG